jgi:hypothetical protein
VTVDFERQRVAVLPGDGLVIRYPGMVCVAAVSENESDYLSLQALLEICHEVAKRGECSGLGRVLARRLAGWLAREEVEITFGAVSVAGDSLTVFLYGAASVGSGGTVLLSGIEAAAWIDRLIPLPSQNLWLILGDDRPVDLNRVSAALHDLRTGTVQGCGVALFSSDIGDVGTKAIPGSSSEKAPKVTRADTEPMRISAPDTPAAPPDPVAVSKKDASKPRRSDPILGTPPSEPPRPSLPMSEDGDGGLSQAAFLDGESVPMAEGHLCSRNHLNDPRSHFCVICGIRMDERTGVLQVGPRPPLGLLVFDDGATFTVDGDYLLGRDPEADRRVRDGELRSIMINDSSGTVSRAHVEIRVDKWDVLVSDAGSANGTFVMRSGNNSWSRLPPRQPLRLVPGTRIGLGKRSFVFESPSGGR